MSHNVDFTNLKRKLGKASTVWEKINILEQLVEVDPTYPFLAMQKKKFKEQLESLRLGAKKKKSRPLTVQNHYQQIKRGKYQACLIGAANTGKSTLLNRLTDSRATISEVPFTTYRPELGTMNYEGVDIQLVEVPAIFAGDSERDEHKYRFLKQTDLNVVLANNQEELDTVLLELWTKGMMLEEKDGPPGLVVYRGNPPITTIPKIKSTQDVAYAIYKGLGILRVYVDNLLQKPICFRNEEADIAKVRDLLERKNRKLRTASILEYDDQWRQVGLDYQLRDGDHIKFQL